MTHHIDPMKLATLAFEGFSDRELADVFCCSDRTILRRRQSLGIKSRWKPAQAAHGTRSRYIAGCRCEPCKSSHAAAMRDYNQRRQQASADAYSFGEPWTQAEDDVLLEVGASRASKRLGRTFFACANRLGRLRVEAAEVSR